MNDQNRNPLAADIAAIDTIVLGCPKCPRRLLTRRRRRSIYRRVTPWAGNIARYRCEGCGYEHPLTDEWVRARISPE
jgi:transposase-like protein